jgi:putative ABC transport system permease protein
MFSPRWRKVLRDLWGNKARTVLVVLSIAVGVFAVGMIAGSQVVFSRALTESWFSINPPSATLYTSPFDEEMLWTVRHMPGVAEADGRRAFGVRFRVKPQGAGAVGVSSNADAAQSPGDAAQSHGDAAQWRNLQISAYPDYNDIRVVQVKPVRGAWPPPKQEILIERASLDWMGVQVGDVIIVEAPNGKLRELRVAGVVHDLSWMAASWTGWAGGYVSPDTLEWLGLPRAFDELNLVVTGNLMDQEHITDVATQIRHKLEKAGLTVGTTWIPTPGQHPAEEVVQPIILLMGVMGSLSLLLSGFLVINTMQALLTQQARQIGIMKAVGAHRGQIMGVYYGMVLTFSLLSLAIAVPLGALAAGAMTGFMAGLINFDVTNSTIPLRVLALEVGVGLVVPLLAALYPILAAVRVTAREAMNDYGLSTARFGRGLLDRLLEQVRGLSRPLLLSLRNTFRRKGRLALTLTTLTLGGAIFIAVFTVRDSLLLTLDDMFDYVDYDALVGFRRAYRIDQIESEALRVPGVVAAEAWQFSSARLIHPDDSESDSINVRASRADSKLVYPTLVAGRWLVPQDENAVVVNTYLLKDEPDIQVGDDITLKIGGQETTWRVVGIIKGTDPVSMAYMNLAYFSQVVGSVGRAGVIFVQGSQHDAAFQSQLAKTLEQHFKEIGLQVSSTQASSDERKQAEAQFNVLIGFLLIMAVLLAVVGGIGLMGTMSLNVLERTREIGVMRAIGASDGAVLQIVIVEGVLIGVLSWMVGAVLALPLSQVLSNVVGDTIMRATLSYTYSLGGVGLWLVIVVVLAALASFLPARNASRVTVRDVLAYE